MNGETNWGPLMGTAVTLHEFYQSLLEAGFNEDQAFTLALTYLQTSVEVGLKGRE